MNIDTTVSSGNVPPKAGVVDKTVAALKKVETGNVETNAALSSLIQLLKEKGAGPSILATLAGFFFDGSADPVPITE
jgi:hypothetical protein